MDNNRDSDYENHLIGCNPITGLFGELTSGEA